jgi:HEPN domain-containing protein
MRPDTVPWWHQAQADMVVAQGSFRPREHYVVAWFVHQAIEKGLKALFIERNGRQAARTHDLLYLGTILNLLPEQMIHLAAIDPAFKFTRYPDIIGLIAPVDGMTEATAVKLLHAGEGIMTWLEPQLQSPSIQP